MKILLNLFLHLCQAFIFVRNQKGSFQITTAFVEGFKETMYMVSQQKTPRLFGRSRTETQNSESDSYERIGTGDEEANDILDRHGDTPINNTSHTRRHVSTQDADWGDLIDRLDRVRLIIRPDDAYVRIGIMTLNRKKDDVFIAAALGLAREGKNGTSTVALPDSRKIVAVAEDGSGASRFNVFTLTLMNAKFDEEDIEDGVTKYFAWSSKVKQHLLNETKATSSDFTTVQALTSGKINEFMGFQFIRSERLPVTTAATNYDPDDGQVGAVVDVLAAGARRCFAWVEDGMLSVTAVDLFADVGPRRDKRMSTQIYVQHSVGAVRMEEEKVLEVLVDETL